jgi:hypothetical protein
MERKRLLLPGEVSSATDKEAVITNDEKSAEAIVGASRRAEQSTQTKNRKVFHAKKPESGGNSP